MLADPVLADPVLADPVLADPVLADPVLADPVSRARCRLGRREGTRHELAQPEPAGRGIKPVLLRLAELGLHGKHLSWF